MRATLMQFPSAQARQVVSEMLLAEVRRYREQRESWRTLMLSRFDSSGDAGNGRCGSQKLQYARSESDATAKFQGRAPEKGDRKQTKSAPQGAHPPPRHGGSRTPIHLSPTNP